MEALTQRRRLTRLSVLAVVVLAIAIGAAALAVMIYVQLKQELAKPRENLQWAVYQLQAEHLRVMLAARRGIEGQLDLDSLDLAYQIFASRILVLVEGEVYASLRVMPGYGELLEELVAAIGSVDEALAEAAPTPPAYARVLLDHLPSFERRLQDVSLSIVADASREQTVRQLEMLETVTYLVVTLVLIVGASIVLGVVTMKQLAALESSRRELAGALDRAEESNRAKGRFLAAISHEMRTPLNAVVGLLREIGYRAGNDGIRGMVATAHVSADMLSGLIDDLVDTTRIESGKFQLAQEPFDPAALFREVADLLAGRAADRGDRIVLDLDGLSAPAVVSDRARLKQVLVNLVGNAVKFTDRGVVTVTAATVEGPGGGTRLRISVADTGIGIAKEQLDAIFTRFFQAEIGEGLGLGLTISRDIVDRLGGRLAVESELGRGTTFRFEVPVALAAMAPTTIVPRPMDGLLSGVRVLVAEDNGTNRMVIELLLRRHKADHVFAVDGAEAVAQAESGDFDLILMDINMPVMGGVEALGEIRHRLGDRTPPTIALTADALPEAIEGFLAAGMVSCVTKPINEGDLLRRIFEALGQTVDLAAVASDRPVATASTVSELDAEKRRAVLALVSILDDEDEEDDGASDPRDTSMRPMTEPRSAGG